MAKTTTLDALAASKAKLLEELQKLEAQECELLQKQTADAFASVLGLLQCHASYFTPSQQTQIASLVAPTPRRSVRSIRSSSKGQSVRPKYWLPHTQETWSGRGSTPKAFAAWEGTAAYNEWKKRHPDEKFPAFPG